MVALNPPALSLRHQSRVIVLSLSFHSDVFPHFPVVCGLCCRHLVPLLLPLLCFAFALLHALVVVPTSPPFPFRHPAGPACGCTRNVLDLHLLLPGAFPPSVGCLHSISPTFVTFVCWGILSLSLSLSSSTFFPFPSPLSPPSQLSSRLHSSPFFSFPLLSSHPHSSPLLSLSYSFLSSLLSLLPSLLARSLSLSLSLSLCLVSLRSVHSLHSSLSFLLAFPLHPSTSLRSSPLVSTPVQTLHYLYASSGLASPLFSSLLSSPLSFQPPQKATTITRIANPGAPSLSL